MAEHVIQAHGIRKRFGLATILDGVTLDVGAGECVALLGANGSGKSTFLRIVATVMRPTAGHLAVLGHDVIRHPDRIRGHVGLVGHGAHVWEDLTALENLRVWRTLANAPTARTALMDALSTVGLDHVADERVRTFSAGMKRRLSLARFVDGAATVLLLDEPFTGLDQAGKKWLSGFVTDFTARGGAALMTTHDLGRALEVAGRIAILSGGVLGLERATAGLDRREIEALYAAATETA